MKNYEVFIDLSDNDGEVPEVAIVITRAESPEMARRNVENALCGIKTDDEGLNSEISNVIDMIVKFEYDFYVWEVSEDDVVEL